VSYLNEASRGSGGCHTRAPWCAARGDRLRLRQGEWVQLKMERQLAEEGGAGE
jgi:hypothetical protein